MIEACPTCLGYVFSEIQATVKYIHQDFDFGLMQMDLCLDLELSMENYVRFSLAEISSH